MALEALSLERNFSHGVGSTGCYWCHSKVVHWIFSLATLPNPIWIITIVALKGCLKNSWWSGPFKYFKLSANPISDLYYISINLQAHLLKLIVAPLNLYWARDKGQGASHLDKTSQAHCFSKVFGARCHARCENSRLMNTVTVFIKITLQVIVNNNQTDLNSPNKSPTKT